MDIRKLRICWFRFLLTGDLHLTNGSRIARLRRSKISLRCWAEENTVARKRHTPRLNPPEIADFDVTDSHSGPHDTLEDEKYSRVIIQSFGFSSINTQTFGVKTRARVVSGLDLDVPCTPRTDLRG